MTDIYSKVYGKPLNCVDTLSGLEDLIMLVNIILCLMKPDFSVNEVTMIAITGAFSSIGMPRH